MNTEDRLKVEIIRKLLHYVDAGLSSGIMNHITNHDMFVFGKRYEVHYKDYDSRLLRGTVAEDINRSNESQALRTLLDMPKYEIEIPSKLHEISDYDIQMAGDAISLYIANSTLASIAPIKQDMGNTVIQKQESDPVMSQVLTFNDIEKLAGEMSPYINGKEAVLVLDALAVYDLINDDKNRWTKAAVAGSLEGFKTYEFYNLPLYDDIGEKAHYGAVMTPQRRRCLAVSFVSGQAISAKSKLEIISDEEMQKIEFYHIAMPTETSGYGAIIAGGNHE